MATDVFPRHSWIRSLALLALLFAALWLAHWPLLRLPYYWDEAGYYIPAAYDFFRRGTLIPYSTLSNAHPPLPSIYLAAWWRLFGFTPLVTRTAMCLVAAVGLAAVYRLARLLTRDWQAAAATLLLTALYPVWFVQSTLAHADLLAAAGTLWGLCFLLEATAAAHELGLKTTLATESAATSGKLRTSRHLASMAAVCFALAALSKEIAVGTPLALALWEGWLWLRTRRPTTRPTAARARTAVNTSFAEPAIPGNKPLTATSLATRPGIFSPASSLHLHLALLLATPAVPLAAWFAFHRWRTGFLFGNPEYLRYNATATLTPARILLAFGHRALHLTAHLNLFVPVLVTLGCLLLPRLAGAPTMRSSDRARLLVVLAANWLFFSVLGGALLTRYLLPLYPLVLVLCVGTWQQRLKPWAPLAALSAVAFVLGFLVNPPYRFAPEDTLAYRDSILLEEHAITQIQARYGSPTVLTAWPAADALTKPELGYVQQPLPVVAIDNFSYPQVKIAQQKAAQEASLPGGAATAGTDQQAPPYTVALLFSTKYDPRKDSQPDPLEASPDAQPDARSVGRPDDNWARNLAARRQALDDRYFGFHHDLPPETIARLLGGTLVWREERNGQWAAVVHFERPQLAWLGECSRPRIRP